MDNKNKNIAGKMVKFKWTKMSLNLEFDFLIFLLNYFSFEFIY